MSDYLLYGLRIRADVPLLAPAQPLAEKPDLIIEAVAALPSWQGELLAGNEALSILLDRSDADAWRVRYQRRDGWLDVTLRPGYVGYCCSSTICAQDIGRVMMPAVMAIYAAMVGRPMLHGALLEIDGRGVALLGQSESGKSTTTAALVAAGCRLVTEELILFPDNAALNFAPGLPLISLSPSTVTYLPRPPRLAPLFRDAGLTRSKLLWLLPTGAGVAPEEQVPLSAICLLDRRLSPDSPPCFSVLPPAEASAAILPHAYWPALQQPAAIEALRVACAPLVASARCGRLSLPAGVDRVFQQAPALKTLLQTLVKDRHDC